MATSICGFPEVSGGFALCSSCTCASVGSSCSPGAASPALHSRDHGLGEIFSLHQQLSIGNPACPGTKANKRSHKKYHRGFFYDSRAAHLYFICLPDVAPCLSLIGLAVLGEIFIFFPSDMIRFVEARAKQRRCGAQSLLLPSPAVPPALCQEKVCSGALLCPARAWASLWSP